MTTKPKTKKPKPQKVIWVIMNREGMMINYDTEKKAAAELKGMQSFKYGPYKYSLGKD